MADELFEAFAAAAHHLHGDTDVEAKYTWAVDTARRLAGAADGAVITREGRELVVYAGDAVIEDRIQDLSQLINAALDGGDLAPAPVAALDGRVVFAARVPVASGNQAALLVAAGGVDELAPGAVEAVSALAANLGAALNNVAATQRLAELEVARREVVTQLQEAVRPATPVVSGSALGVHYQAADPQEPTGGDLYDWQVLPDGDLYVAVIDVMGKGVAATKDAVALAHVLRVLVLQGTPLGKVIREADDLLGLHHPELAATMVVARYDPSDGELRVASGGHPPPLIVRANGTTEYLDVAGAPLGFPGAGSEDVAVVHLDRADSVIFYTDGVIEARKDIILGLEELAETAALTSRYPARQQARALVERALAGAARRDDSLVLVLRRRIPPHRTTTGLRPFQYCFSPNPAAVGLVRHLLADWLRLQDVDDVDAEDPLLVVSELAANAVAASGDGQAQIAARAHADESSLVIEMESTGSGRVVLPDLGDDEVPDLDAASGRGLFLVTTLSDRLDVEDIEDGRVVVRAVFEQFFP